jgi:hypothetical protein
MIRLDEAARATRAPVDALRLDRHWRVRRPARGPAFRVQPPLLRRPQITQSDDQSEGVARLGAIDVEHNYEEPKRSEIELLLKGQGYQRVHTWMQDDFYLPRAR